MTPLCLLANMYLELALVFVMMDRDPWRESGDPPGRTPDIYTLALPLIFIYPYPPCFMLFPKYISPSSHQRILFSRPSRFIILPSSATEKLRHCGNEERRDKKRTRRRSAIRALVHFSSQLRSATCRWADVNKATNNGWTSLHAAEQTVTPRSSPA